jgi:hypothetical protein
MTPKNKYGLAASNGWSDSGSHEPERNRSGAAAMR